jgi:hypothetical protein
MNENTTLQYRKAYVAESRKHIATPKKNVEKTMMSAVEEVSYLGSRFSYTMKGNVKNRTEPRR